MPAGGSRPPHQKRTGSAFGLSVFFDKQDVAFLQGTRRSFRSTSNAGRWVDTEFCEACGTSVSFTLELRPALVAITGGTFDTPSFWYDLDNFNFARTKPAWLAIPDGLTAWETADYDPEPKAYTEG